MKSFRETLQGPAGKVIAGVVVVVGLASAYASYRAGGPSLADQSLRRTFVDAETGQPFPVTLTPDMVVPVKSPFTGRDTGVEPELCYWTADGQPKDVPDPVLLNANHIPPLPGPTFCPVCHRLVIGHNPRALPGMKPPITEADYKAQEH